MIFPGPARVIGEEKSAQNDQSLPVHPVRQPAEGDLQDGDEEDVAGDNDA